MIGNHWEVLKMGMINTHIFIKVILEILGEWTVERQEWKVEDKMGSYSSNPVERSWCLESGVLSVTVLDEWVPVLVFSECYNNVIDWWFINYNKNYFSQFWRLESPKSRCLADLVRAHFLFHIQLPSCYVFMLQKNWGTSLGLFYKNTNSIHEGSILIT